MQSLALLLSSLWFLLSAPPPLPQAHSHNDYEQPRPLLDALENGFCSLEADIHLVKGDLLVAHDPGQIDPKRTLENLYLAPLQKFIENQGGRVYENGPSVLLLIDIKTEGEKTYLALRPLLEKYRSMLTTFSPGRIQTNAVTVVLSGNRPRQLLLAEPNRCAAYDGRLSDLGSDLPLDFMPLVSDNWRNHFSWRGSGPFPETEKQKLKNLVETCRQEGRWLRFWAIPDQPSAWKELLQAGVSLINTDHLASLREFLLQNSAE